MTTNAFARQNDAGSRASNTSHWKILDLIIVLVWESNNDHYQKYILSNKKISTLWNKQTAKQNKRNKQMILTPSHRETNPRT